MNRGVLVVEDDPDLLSLMEMILADGGYRVALRREGGEALARVAEQHAAGRSSSTCACRA